jgi:hypothetical protein
MQDARPILIDASEAGRLLGMLPARVTRLAKRGELPCVVLPDGELRYSEEDLREWVAEFRRPANGTNGGR